MPTAVSSRPTGFVDAPPRQLPSDRWSIPGLVQRINRSILGGETEREHRASAVSWPIAMAVVPVLLLIAYAMDFALPRNVDDGFLYSIPLAAACLLLGRWGMAVAPVSLALYCYSLWAVTGAILPSNFLMRVGELSTVGILTLVARLFYLDLALRARELAEQSAALQKELELAQRLQSCLYNIPPEGYRQGDLVIHAHCQPLGAVGGDLCHLMPHEDGLNLFVGDAIGKGVPAALLMAMCTAVLARSTRRARHPGAALEECNRLLAHHFDRGADATVTATAFFGAFPSDSQDLVFSLAGHEPPVMLGAAGQPDAHASGVLMGAVENAQYREVRVPFGPGARMIVFTDGAVEIRNEAGEEFGRERLEAAARRHGDRPGHELLEGILREITTFSGGTDRRDDLALVVVERAPQPFG